jgi:hypothetical protein
MESTTTLIVREVAFWLTLARLDQFLRKRATRSKTRELVWPSYSIAYLPVRVPDSFPDRDLDGKDDRAEAAGTEDQTSR